MKRILLLSFAFLTVIAFSAMAQRTVSGKVTDDAGEALPGVNVVIKGTTTGVTTDLDGNYRISVDDGATLVFSFVGFETQEIQVGSRTTIDISMGGATELQEVVVTAVGIETNKAQLGYAIQNVEADEIIQSKETNLVNALNSKVAGVNVISSSGSPGASARITIRGQTSITGSNEPLFVIDGVPLDNSSRGNGVAGVDQGNRLIDVNPNDIASLTVLKGPAATALYGIRAANGAIIITTKRGSTGAPRITLNSSVTFDEVNRNYDIQQRWAQGRPVSGAYTWRGPDTGEGFSWGPEISSLEYDGSEYPYDRNGRLVAAGTGNGVPARSFDNNENFFVTGRTMDNNLSISGGTESVKYFISAGRLSQEGVVPNATFNRTSFRSTITADLTDKLSVTVSGTYSNSGGNRIQRGSNISGVMLGLLRTSPTFDNGNGKTGQDAADDPDTYLLPDGSQRSYRAGIYDNPFWTANKNPFEDDVDRVIGYINPTYEILPWLKASFKAGVDHYTDKRNFAFDINSATQPAGQVDIYTNETTVLNTDALLTASKDLNEELYLTATIGHNYWERESQTKTATGTTMAIPGFYHISNTTDILAAEGYSLRKLHGVFGDVKLSWRDMVHLNLTGRNDWSSTLPEDNNSFFYPSASLGFVLTEAIGLTNSSALPYMKLRASWGQVGNDAGVYNTNNVFTQAFIGGDGFINGITFPALTTNSFERLGQLGNTVLKPETTETIEVGFDAKFLNGRINLDFTYYDSETIDQIIPLTISAATGFTSRVANAGVISNTGYEVVLSGTPYEANGFSWDVNVNFTQYESIVEELEVDDIGLAGFVSTSSRIRVGEPYGAIVGNSYQRTDDGQLIVGSNGWPLVDSEQDVIGDPNPDWLAGIRNTFSYKGISLSALLDIRKGGDVWNGTLGIIRYFGTAAETADQRTISGYIYDGVVQTGTDGDGNPTYSPNTTPVDFANPVNGLSGIKWVRYGFGGVSEDAIEDASWVRLREVTISYQLPKSLLSNIEFLEGASISLSGRNLWLDTGFTGIDPETNLTGDSNGFGLNYFNMPNTKSYGASIKLMF